MVRQRILPLHSLDFPVTPTIINTFLNIHQGDNDKEKTDIATHKLNWHKGRFCEICGPINSVLDFKRGMQRCFANCI